MDQLNKFYKQEDVVSFLHDILVDSKIAQENISLTLNDGPQKSNQYYLCTVMDIIMKYQILHKEKANLPRFVESLKKIKETSNNYHDFLFSCNQLLVNTIQETLQLENQTDTENKEKILSFAYQNYIVNGFCFHVFPSAKEELVKKQGLETGQEHLLYESMKEVDEIFRLYKIKDIFGEEINNISKNYFDITDSPFMAFLYAMETPEYFCRFTSNGTSLKEIDTTNLSAYLLKNYDECSKNIENLCNQKGMTETQKEIVINYFQNQWKQLEADTMYPVCAVIERSAVGRDKLPDYEKILRQSKNEEILYSLSKILDSRFPRDKRYTKVLLKEFDLLYFPTYKEIENYTKKNEVIEEDETPQQNTIKNNLGYAGIIALIGILFIALGLTWIVVRFYLIVR